MKLIKKFLYFPIIIYFPITIPRCENSNFNVISEKSICVGIYIATKIRYLDDARGSQYITGVS